MDTMSIRTVLNIVVAACIVIIVSAFRFGKLQTASSLPVPQDAPELSYAIQTNDLSGKIDFNDRMAVFEGQPIEVPLDVLKDEKRYVLGANNENKWIEVDLSEQRLKAWEGSSLFLETLISTGLPSTPTPKGEFRIWTKLRATRMRGGTGRYAYNLPNVPYTMFFEGSGIPGWKGYGLHGAYWHNAFGTQRSHGCVNLPIEIAKQLYYWVGPELPEGKSSIRSTAENLGTRIIIHD
jgi:lipoprotein-anchoring transpeptidase ErfK/SrfK